MHGILPTSLLRGATCSPPTPLPSPYNDSLHRQSPTGTSSPRPPLSASTTPEPLRVLSVNCGGASSKLPRLVALLLFADADVVCLQEAAGFPPDCFCGLPYRSWHGPPLRGGGLVILLHPRRLLQPTPRHPPILDDHLLFLCVPLTATAHLSIANLHLPPSLASDTRRNLCGLAAAALSRSPPGLRIIMGGLNTTLGSADGCLRPALGRYGVWEGWPISTPTSFRPTESCFISVFLPQDENTAFKQRSEKKMP